MTTAMFTRAALLVGFLFSNAACLAEEPTNNMGERPEPTIYRLQGNRVFGVVGPVLPDVVDAETGETNCVYSAEDGRRVERKGLPFISPTSLAEYDEAPFEETPKERDECLALLGHWRRALCDSTKSSLAVRTDRAAGVSSGRQVAFHVKRGQGEAFQVLVNSGHGRTSRVRPEDFDTPCEACFAFDGADSVALTKFDGLSRSDRQLEVTLDGPLEEAFFHFAILARCPDADWWDSTFWMRSANEMLQPEFADKGRAIELAPKRPMAFERFFVYFEREGRPTAITMIEAGSNNRISTRFVDEAAP